jgi:beta-glucosidase-like glycosyl hydrolase
VTDSIEARGVLRYSSVEVAAERSIAAGADMVLMTGSGSWKRVFPHLLGKAKSSPAFRRKVARAARRVLVLKRKLGLGPPPG